MMLAWWFYMFSRFTGVAHWGRLLNDAVGGTSFVFPLLRFPVASCRVRSRMLMRGSRAPQVVPRHRAELTEGGSRLLHYSRCGSVTGKCAHEIPLKVEQRVLVSACPV